MPQTMGFRAAQTALPKSRILLIASLAETDVHGLADYVAGADAGLLSISKLTSGAKAIQEACRVMPEIPWGGWLGNLGREEIKPVEESGCDFVVFPAVGTSLATFQNNGVGKILQVEASLNEGLLMAVDELPIDAILIVPEQGEHFLTWHHLMIFQHFADVLTKPLLALVPLKVTAAELKAVWEVGLSGVVLEVGQAKGRIGELRQSVDRLTFPPQRKRDRGGVLLPPIREEEGEEE